MKKYLRLLILPFLFCSLLGCDEEDDVKPIYLTAFAGTWEVVDQDNQELFETGCLLDIQSSQIHEGFGGYQGYITTYYLTDGGATLHDKVFSWSIREVEQNRPLLDVVYQGELDGDNVWSGNYYYKITELGYENMSWQVNSNGDNSTIRFKRRSDIQSE